MSNIKGILITLGYVLVFIGALFLRRLLLKKDEKRYRLLIIIFEWFNVFLPTALLFTLGDQWFFSDAYLPSQLPQDLIFSTFHLLMIGLTLLGVIIYLKRAHKDLKSEKTYFKGRLNQVDYEVLKLGVMLIGIEVYKQLIHLNLINGLSNYNWNGFPLQFCSLPLYLYVIVPFIKNKKIKESFYYYFALYSLMGGLSVTLTGIGVFNLDVSVSLHTMIWHGTMVITGLYLGIITKFGQNYHQYFKASYIYLGSVVFIQIVNTIFHFISLKHPSVMSFDGFYISPWGSDMSVPYLSALRFKLNEVGTSNILTGLVITISYVMALSLGAFLVFLLYQQSFKRHLNYKFQKGSLQETLEKDEDVKPSSIQK